MCRAKIEVNPKTNLGAPFGAQNPSVGLSELFAGGLDEVEIFNRALNSSEVQALYQAGSAAKCK